MAEVKMSFIEHLEELRRRIIVMFLSLGVAVCVGYIYSWEILDFLKEPAIKAQIPLNLYYQTVLEPFMVRFKIAMYAAIVLALPVILYELIAYIAPALRKREKKFMYAALFFIIIFFLAGVAFCYFYILPVGLDWLVGQAAGRISPVLMAGDYVGLVALLMLAIGIAFETPLVVWLVVRLGIITPQRLHKNWRWAVIVILAFAALITPDWNPITMMLVAFPMFLLYEGSIFMAMLGRKGAERRRKEKEAALEAED
ncbi:MAG: twin-arginine translocase subunit TatC [Actinomycetota bacterium]|nr:twin-arginine translocase subunit TatC [Actinomycetota bacterium]